MSESPYRISLEEFERRVAVDASARTEMVGLPPEATPMNGDEAVTLHWSSGTGVVPGGGDHGDGD